MVQEHINNCVNWIRDWFSLNGDENTKAIVGISGGKDSTAVAALCVKALEKDRVIGVLMPNGVQTDITDSYKVCEKLGIKHFEINIENAYNSLTEEITNKLNLEKTEQYKTNTPSRIRMTTLYGVAALIGNCRVANTSNLSELMVGYSTLWGDSVGDFAPLADFTSDFVMDICKELGFENSLSYKTPTDGMSGKPDEVNLGFTYKELNNYIINGKCDNHIIRKRVKDFSWKRKLINIPYYKVIVMD